MEYKPVRVYGFLRVPWGYYIPYGEKEMAVPDKEKLELLHYAFRMRAKLNTSLSDCCMWLHAASGQLITVAGFQILYKKWLRKIKKNKFRRLNKEFDAKIKDLKELFVDIYDREDVSAVAFKKVRDAWQKKEINFEPPSIRRNSTDSGQPPATDSGREKS